MSNFGKHKPGSWAALHQDKIYPSNNPYGIPDLSPVSGGSIPAWLIPYRQRARPSDGSLEEGAVHFFLDDFRFESVWNQPKNSLRYLSKFRLVLTPDFSLYKDYPLAMQVWNVYRSRWVGRFWSEQGKTVIPTVSWSTYESYEYAFAGLPRRSVVAVSAVGLRKKEAWLNQSIFLAGFREMVQTIKPMLVLAYGQLPAICYDLAEIATYPTRWESIRKARQASYDVGYAPQMVFSQ